MEKVAAVGIVWYLIGGFVISMGVPVDESFQYGLAFGGMIVTGAFQFLR